MFELISVEEALDAYDKYESAPSLMVGDGLWVFGTPKSIVRAQMYMLANSTHPVERADINRYLAAELKRVEHDLATLRLENAALREQTHAQA